jgi:NADH-quinone oxidoreductase subunit E
VGKADREIPEGRQQSAVIPLLWRAQEQAGGWVPQKAIEAWPKSSTWRNPRTEIAMFYTMLQLAGGRRRYPGVGTTPCMLRGAEDPKVCEDQSITNRGSFRLTAIYLGKKSNVLAHV